MRWSSHATTSTGSTAKINNSPPERWTCPATAEPRPVCVDQILIIATVDQARMTRIGCLHGFQGLARQDHRAAPGVGAGGGLVQRRWVGRRYDESGAADRSRH